jgi:hypothetical protein
VGPVPTKTIVHLFVNDKEGKPVAIHQFIGAHGRLVLVASRYEPEELFRHRPPVDRVMGLEEM